MGTESGNRNDQQKMLDIGNIQVDFYFFAALLDPTNDDT